MANNINESILNPEDRELFSAMGSDLQKSILEELSNAEKKVGKKIYISGFKKYPNGVNVIYSFGNLFLI